ncbi:MAG: universal stress protein, partial [Myxococcales bacterium]|nr:universal stress protein [Myxococcales bacterium]
AALASTAVARDTSAEAHLEALAQARPGVGLILGRRAPTAGGRVVRLGRVARRLLRALPGPVVIVPPDLDPATLGDGPVIATTDARDDSLPACRFAVALARALGRSALLVHVVPTPDVWIHEAVMLPPEQVFGRLQAEGEAVLARWAQRHELDALERFVDVGGVVHGVEAIAQARNAPLIVCGSRQLGAIPRFFAGSVASELAASSRLPVAVIPHDYKDRRNAEAAS